MKKDDKILQRQKYRIFLKNKDTDFIFNWLQ